MDLSLDQEKFEPCREQKPEYRICGRCIMDTTIPGVVFDENGECNFCKVHDDLEERYPLDARGRNP